MWWVYGSQITVGMPAQSGAQVAVQAAKLVEHGYVRRYMRSLQIADVVNSMTDLMHMSQCEPSPIAALQQFHMSMAKRQPDESPESRHSMPNVTSNGQQTSPDNPQQQPQHQHQQQHQQQSQSRQQAQSHRQQSQPMPPASQQHSTQLNGRHGRQSSAFTAPSLASVQGNGHMGPAAQALASPCHSVRSGASPFAQQAHSSGKPPTPRGARR